MTRSVSARGELADVAVVLLVDEVEQDREAVAVLEAHAAAVADLEGPRDLLLQSPPRPSSAAPRGRRRARRSACRRSACRGSWLMVSASWRRACGGRRARRGRTARPVGRPRRDAARLADRVSSIFWKRPACDFSALASVSNQSAISAKPSSRAVFAMPGYMSVYSWVSPATEALRFCAVSPIGRPVAGSPTCLQVVEVAVRVAGLAVGGLAEVAGDLGVALDVGDLREVEVAAVRLRLAGERVLQVLVRLRALQVLGHRLILLLRIRLRSALLLRAVRAEPGEAHGVVLDAEARASRLGQAQRRHRPRRRGPPGARSASQTRWWWRPGHRVEARDAARVVHLAGEARVHQRLQHAVDGRAGEAGQPRRGPRRRPGRPSGGPCGRPAPRRRRGAGSSPPARGGGTRPRTRRGAGRRARAGHAASDW